MPELPGASLSPWRYSAGRLVPVDVFPEVERATKLLRGVAVSKTIVDIEAAEDTIVFSGNSHTEFVRLSSINVLTRPKVTSAVFFRQPN